MSSAGTARRRRAGWTLLALIVLACGLACARREREPRPIVLIVLDTARQDRLSVYGYGRPTSPNLEAFAKESRTFTNAYSTSNWTVPAHASMFTGLYPEAHHATMDSWSLTWKFPLEFDTVAEILKGHGYESWAFSGNAHIRPGTQFAQGFDRFFSSWYWSSDTAEPWPTTDGRRMTEDERTVEELKSLLKARTGDKPLFLFFNLIGPHSPYDSCEPYTKDFLTNPAEDYALNFALDFNMRKRRFSDGQIRSLNDRYDAELRKADDLTGQILGALKDSGLYKDALIIVTADHGENIGDHGQMGHEFTLYDTTCRVPLLVRHPGSRRFRAGSRDDVPAQLTDVFPTMLEASGIDPGDYENQGISLGERRARRRRPPLMSWVKSSYYGEIQPEAVFYYDRGSLVADQRARAIVEDGFKYILREDGDQQLYDLRADPGELRNLAGEPAQRDRLEDYGNELRRLSKSYERPIPEAAPAQPDGEGGDSLGEQARKNLEKLGYLRGM